MRTVFAGGRVFDGTGSRPAQADVVIEDDRIVDVGQRLDGDQSVDVSGKTILPGMFDCHVHILLSHIDVWRHMQTPYSYRFYEGVRNLEATLRIGITTIRDAAGADLGVKQAVENGLIAGPRMQISIAMLSQTGGHGDSWMPSGAGSSGDGTHPGHPSGIVDGTDEMRKKVRELVRAGADVIKVCVSRGVL
jgi:imidazolonepropionase-like amidohydrolase